MSGGALDYLYIDVEDAGDAIQELTNDRILCCFALTLRRVSNALRAVEMALSGDTSIEEAHKAIHYFRKESEYDDPNYHDS